jgi:hypothetical protein
MAPRLKNLNVLWVKERKPDILSFPLLKVPASKSPYRFPSGPLWGEIPTYRAVLNIS